MGYSHYIYQPKEIKKEAWNAIIKDTKKAFDYIENELGITLADGRGTPGSRPVFTEDEIFFNGSDAQGIGVWTTSEEISIPWPDPLASIADVVADPSADKTSGSWFAGTLVSQRVAPIDNNTGKGSGAYETAGLSRIAQGNESKPGLFFDCVKTAYRPYDLAVTAFYAIVKHHVPECEIHSDGEEKDWTDAMILCHNLLGYPFECPLVK